jgi:hypothetical protein
MLSGDDSSVYQIEDLRGMNRILPSSHPTRTPSPEEGKFHEIIYDTGADVQLSHLLASSPDEVLILAVKLYPSGKRLFCSFGRTTRCRCCRNSSTSPHVSRLPGVCNSYARSWPLPWHPFSAECRRCYPRVRGPQVEDILDISSSSNLRIQESVSSILSKVGLVSKSADDVNGCVNAGLPQAFLKLLMCDP